MLSRQFDNKAIPSKTTNFLCPCNEDVEECIPVFKQSKKEFIRSYSCDVILPKKPHPFRSPMTFLRSTTLPRSYKKQLSDSNSNYAAKFKALTIAHTNDSEWSLDEEYPVCSHMPTATTDNTPFCGFSNQPYYTKRQSLSLGKLNKKKGSRSSQNVEQTQFDGHYATMRHSRKEKEEDFEARQNSSLRRRASSLDFLPESVTKSCAQNGASAKSTPFGRTTSLSQRSPFRKKVSYAAEQETSLQGIKELRPKTVKRLRSGLDALFDAIEKQDVEELRKVLSTADVSINEPNTDQFTPLDMALMSGEAEIATILLEHGGIENPALADPNVRGEHLENLIEIADKKVNEYTTTIVNSVGDAKENERQLREWEWRLFILRVMQKKIHNTEPPSAVPSLTVASLSNDSVVISITPVANEDPKNMITKYKVEWSKDEEFSKIEGTQLLTNKRQLSCTITGLEKSISWYFRVQAGNLKGFSESGYPDPRAIIPSSWYECSNCVYRHYGTADKLCPLIDDLYSFQKQGSEKVNEGISEEESVSYSQDMYHSPKERNKKMSRGLSRYTNLIFNSAPKLLKKIKRRGIYMAALLYSDDNSHVLVTMDENLPVVECGDNFSKSFTQEIYWFVKASCTWKDIQHMLCFSNKSHSSQAVQIRRKLVQSALALMNATGVTDLGPIHYKPFKDSHGSILLLAVNCIKKNVTWSRAMVMKWIAIQKLLKKTSSINEHILAPEKLIPSVQELVACHRKSRIKLPRGLYLGYLKLRTSVDTLSIMVPNHHTNILPYVKIQDIPNVTKEEWQWLKNIEKFEQTSDAETPPSLRRFEKRLKKAVHQLFLQLNIDEETAMNHRIYDEEVIELSLDVLFILICPPSDEICTPPNQQDGFTDMQEYSALPFQAFELANMMTYQPKIMSSYCRLSSILELETYCMQQVLRQTICLKELKRLKERQCKLSEFQHSVDELWRSSRWVFDAIQACQDRNLNAGIRLSCFFTNSDWEKDDLRCSGSSSSNVGLHSDFSEIENETFDDADNPSKSDHVLAVYGTQEVGLLESSCVELNIEEGITTSEVVKMAAQQFNTISLVNSDSSIDVFNSKDAVCDDSILDRLCLVANTGTDEIRIINEKSLLEVRDLWNKGKLYLRLKDETVKTSKEGLSTTV